MALREVSLARCADTPLALMLSPCAAESFTLPVGIAGHRSDSLKINQSWLGFGLSVLYLAGAIYIVEEELRYTGGGWINLRGLGVVLVTFPSQLTLGLLLKELGVPEVNYSSPGLLGYCQLVLHVAVCALLVYLLGYGVEWLVRRGLRALRAGA
jgi:hypothetical protein